MDEDETVAYMEPQLRAAATLGFPVVRMQFGATPELIERLVPTAERLGMAMGMEIHSPHTVDHPVMLALREPYDRLDSPSLGFIPDFGASVSRHPPMLFEAFDQAGVPEEATLPMVEAWNARETRSRGGWRSDDRLEEMGVSGDHMTLVGKGFGLFGRQDPRDGRRSATGSSTCTASSSRSTRTATSLPFRTTS